MYRPKTFVANCVGAITSWTLVNFLYHVGSVYNLVNLVFRSSSLNGLELALL